MSTPNLTLPQNPGNKKTTGKFSWGFFLLIILQVAILGFTFFPNNQIIPQKENQQNDHLKKTAIKLEEVELRTPAVNVWKKYIQSTSLSHREKSSIYTRIGKLLHNAEKYEEAIEYYFLAKELTEEEEARRKLVQHISSSLENLKRFHAMNTVLEEQVTHQHEKEKKEVVAEIETREIGKDDLENIIEVGVENRIQTMRLAFPQMVNQQPNIASQMKKQYETLKGKKTALEEYLFTEVLWRKALADELEKNPHHLKQLKQIQKKMLSQEILQREINRQIVVLPEEVKAIYENGKDQYQNPPSAKAGFKIFATEEEAKIANLTQKSFDKEKVEVNAMTSHLPEYGDITEVVKDIFATKKNGLYEKIYKTEKGFLKVWVESLTTATKKPLEEVQQQIQQQLYQRKYQQIMQQFMTELYEKYKVKIYLEVPEEKSDNN